jgi:small-conductance mechanosensitive channel
MNGANRLVTSSLLGLIASLVFGLCLAQADAPLAQLEALNQQQSLSDSDRQQALISIEEQARACVRERREQLAELAATMDLLAPDEAAADTATTALAAERRSMQDALAGCQLALLRINQRQENLRSQGRAVFLDRLRASPLPDFAPQWPWLSILPWGLGGFLLGLLMRSLLLRQQAGALQAALARALPWLGSAGMLTLGLDSVQRLLPLLFILAATFAARGWLAFQRRHPSDSPSPRWLSPLLILLGLSLAGREVLSLWLGVHPGVPPYRAVLGALGAMLALGLTLGLWSRIASRSLRMITVLMTLALVLAATADILSRPMLGDYLTHASMATLVGVGAWLAMNQTLGNWLAESRMGRSLVLVLAVRMVAVLLLAGWIIWAWDLPALGLGLDWQSLIGGFAIGNIHINPLRLAMGAITALSLLVLARWLQRLTGRDLAKQRGVDPAAGTTVVTIIGYIGVVVSLLVAFSVAGIDLTNLVIIAGALSLGIGFGLQTIVSNFVSGIILLFERPIRNGDWISVGNVEGLVTRVRVRATVIRSFDGADIVMPNSDLLAANVTNWTLTDPAGRVVIPVGIAYGSDTRKATELLLQAAREAENVVLDGSLPEPNVVFFAFGESSLDLNLRFYIADVRNRLLTASATHYRIDELFREHGIEIAFPQRDVHLRSVPGAAHLAPPLD